MTNNRSIKKVEECLDKTNFSVWKVKTQDCLPSGDFPIIDQWKDLIAGYSNDKSLLYDWELPVIIYWDHTNIVKYVDFPFICGADWTKVFKLKKDIDTRFFVYLLEFYKPETQWYRRHYSLLKEISFPLPPLSTQKLIVAKLDEAFASLDESISLTKENIIRLDEVTKSVLDKVFEEGEREKVKLWDIIDNYDWQRVPIKAWNRINEKWEYPYYGASGIIDYVDEYIYDWEYLLISEDWANLVARKYPIAFIASGRFWVNNHAHIVKGKEWIVSNRFLEICFINLDISSYITWSAQPKLSQKMMNIIEIPLPPLSKQQEIVSYLDQVFAQTKQIKAEYEAKLQQLKELKSSILQSAFEGKLI